MAPTSDYEAARFELLERDPVFHGIPIFGASVRGIEVTQSIQRYRSSEHLTDPADRGPDNSVRLVAGKSAWVRVYVQPGLFPDFESLGGTLEVERRRPDLSFEPALTLSPTGATTIRPVSIDYDTERRSIGRTLNFVIPARQFHGMLRLTAHLASDRSPSKTILVSVRLEQTLRIRGIMVAYSGPSSAIMPLPGQPPLTQLTLPAPTVANLQQTSATALAAMPVKGNGSFASAGVVNWTTPLDDARTGAGACSVNWGALLTRLALAQTNDGNRADVVYYGLLPTGMPLNVPGCGRAGLGGGKVNDQGTLMHEIGHGYGFAHTPCGAAGTTDPNYPVYEPYGSASIGEFGLDIRNGTIQDPQSTRDYMSYCFPQWMSLYQHNRLLEHPRLAPRWLREGFSWPWAKAFEPEHSWWPNPPWVLADDDEQWKVNPMISLIGEVGDDGEVTVTSVAHVRVAGQPNGIRTNWIAQLTDDAGRAITRAPLFRMDTFGGGGCGCGGEDSSSDPDRAPFHFQAFVPDVERGADKADGVALRILDGAEEVWSRRAPGDAPVFADASAKVDSDRLLLEWDVRAAVDPDVWAQWSTDRGAHWHGLAIDLADGSAELPLMGLPAGMVLLRLLAHDGFSTAESKPIRVELPERAPDVAIMHPADDQELRVGGITQLAGNAVDSEGMPLADESLRWTLDGERVGVGREVWIAAPDAGRHELRLDVRWSGGEESSTVAFTTVAEPF